MVSLAQLLKCSVLGSADPVSKSIATGTVRRKTPVRDPVLEEIGTTREKQLTPKCRKLHGKAKHFSRNICLMIARRNFIIINQRKGKQMKLQLHSTSWLINFYESRKSYSAQRLKIHIG
ncbi:hypothetical protein Trydic_g1514 [Trypoxylus dichotomus]